MNRLFKFQKCLTAEMNCLLIHQSLMLRFKQIGLGCQERLQVQRAIATGLLTIMWPPSAALINRETKNQLPGNKKLLQKHPKKLNREAKCITNHSFRHSLKSRITDRIRKWISQTKLQRVLPSTSLKTHLSMPSTLQISAVKASEDSSLALQSSSVTLSPSLSAQ